MFTKCQRRLQDDAKAIAIPRGFSENSRAKKKLNSQSKDLQSS